MYFENKMLRKSVSVLAVLMVMTAVLCGCGKENEKAATEATEAVQSQTTVATEAPARWELVVESVEDQENVVVVTTSVGQIKYPFAFADLIQVKAMNEETVASLEFAALISGSEYPLYALHFGGSEGIALGTMEIAGEEEPRTVYAEFYSAEEAALGEHIGTFRAVQETFNDVVASLSDIPGFVSAQ